jgi:hypothetical protein
MIQFVGGPFDGHTQEFAFVPQEHVALPINDNVFKMLNGERREVLKRVERVALYRHVDGKMMFECICPARNLKLQDWRV